MSKVKLTSRFGFICSQILQLLRLVTQIYQQMATNARVINRFADLQNVYRLSNALSTNIYVAYEQSHHVIFISVLISCQSLILAKCESNLHPLRHRCVCQRLHRETSYVSMLPHINLLACHVPLLSDVLTSCYQCVNKVSCTINLIIVLC